MRLLSGKENIKPVKRAKRYSSSKAAIINVLTSSSEDEDTDSSESDSEEVSPSDKDKAKSKYQEEMGFGWVNSQSKTLDSRGGANTVYGARLSNHFESDVQNSALAYFLHFFPLKHLRYVIIPLTNSYGSTAVRQSKVLTVKEFLCWIGIGAAEGR